MWFWNFMNKKIKKKIYGRLTSTLSFANNSLTISMFPLSTALKKGVW